MNEPIRTIEIAGGVARVYENQITRYEDDEGDVIATLPFPVDEKIAALALVAYQAGHDQGYNRGHRAGRQGLVKTIHELLGVDKITAALEGLEEK